MLKKVKDSTIAILKNNALNKLNINRKIKQDDIDIVLEFLWEEEKCYANADNDGEVIDRQYLLDVCTALTTSC